MKKIKISKKIVSMTALILVVFLFASQINTIAYEDKSINNAEETLQELQAGNINRDLSSASISKIDKSTLNEGQKKLGTDLLRLTIDSPEVSSSEREQIKENLKLQESYIDSGNAELNGLIESAGDLVYVYIYLNKGIETKTIDEYVNTVTDRDEVNNIAVAWVGVANIEKLSQNEGVCSIRTVMPPMVRSGSVNSQGDSLLKADLFRSANGINGSGIKVGIISNGVDNIASAISSDDLPAGVTVLSNTVHGDEGTAMLEIVYDLAPGAELYFHDCGNNDVAFNSAITELADAGCDIICDDIGWYDQPYFEDGTIASNINSLLSSKDIIYVTAAGNDAVNHYQAPYNVSTHYLVMGGVNCPYHDADPNITGQQPITITVPAGGYTRVFLQWDDRYGVSSNDYDMLLTVYNEESGHYELEDYSTYTQDGTGGNDYPFEWVEYNNTSDSDKDVYVDITRWSGVAKTLEIFAIDYVKDMDYVTTADSIFGHAAVPDVIAVGAINASTPNNIAYYSSRGPCKISYPSSQSRQKPDLCAIDGVSVTGAGGFPSTFYGTSASAPHVAAVAALIWAQSPLKTPSEIRAMLRGGTTDMGSSGFDCTYGYGLLNTLKAGVPAIPKSLSVTPGDKTAALSWSANIEPDLNGYQVEYKLSSAPTWTTAQVSKTSTNYTVTGLLNGREYNFRIMAKDVDNNWSSYTSTVTRDLAPKDITLAGVVINKNGQLVFMEVDYYINVRSAGMFVYDASNNPIPPSYVKSSEGDYYLVADFINARSATTDGTNIKAFDLLLNYPAYKQNITTHTVEYVGGQFVIH